MKNEDLFNAISDADVTLLTDTVYDFPPVTFEYQRGVKEAQEAILRHMGIYHEYLKWKGEM